jgi:hypothetical protein
MSTDYRAMLAEVLAMFERSLAQLDEILAMPSERTATDVNAFRDSRESTRKQIETVKSAIARFDQLNRTQ